MELDAEHNETGMDFVIQAGREKWKQLPSHSHECSWIDGTQRWQNHLFLLRGNVSRKGVPLLSFSKQFLLLTIRSLEGHTPTFISLLANDLNQSVLPFSHNAVENQLFPKKLQRHSDSSASLRPTYICGRSHPALFQTSAAGSGAVAPLHSDGNISATAYSGGGR